MPKEWLEKDIRNNETLKKRDYEPPNSVPPDAHPEHDLVTKVD
jgi:hypothetical protein